MPSVYIETSIVSHASARPNNDPITRALQIQARRWWDDERHAFDLYTSQVVIDEASLGDPAAAAELQWRISVPVTLLVLTVLAVPLSRSAPREGRYSRVTVGILVYVIYSNLLGAAKVWVEQGVVPQVIGMWWVHALFLLVAIGMLLHQYGVFSNLKLAPQTRMLP